MKLCTSCNWVWIHLNIVIFDEAKVKFPTAAFAVFELDIDDWADIKDGCGRLVHFARPRDLDPDLGPEY